MVSSALLGLCLSLLADVFPVGPGTLVGLATGARAELNVGRIPVTSVDSSSPGTEERITLRSGVRLVSRTSTFSLAYTPQYYLRLPDVLQIGRPLILHSGALDWTARPNRRLTLNWITHSSAGELPNSGLSQVFEPGTGLLKVVHFVLDVGQFLGVANGAIVEALLLGLDAGGEPGDFALDATLGAANIGDFRFDGE